MQWSFYSELQNKSFPRKPSTWQGEDTVAFWRSMTVMTLRRYKQTSRSDDSNLTSRRHGCYSTKNVNFDVKQVLTVLSKQLWHFRNRSCTIIMLKLSLAQCMCSALSWSWVSKTFLQVDCCMQHRWYIAADLEPCLVVSHFEMHWKLGCCTLCENLACKKHIARSNAAANTM